ANRDFADLEALFTEARQGADQMPAGLMARIVADADRVQTGFDRPVAPVTAPGVWAQIMQVLGGWPAMGGLAAACAAGVWIGLAPPSFLPDPAGYVFESGADLDLIGGNQLALAMAEER
ncbi:MAG: hypothetical protein COC12_05295, partial [Rhodobacteraceae bacterium]